MNEPTFGIWLLDQNVPAAVKRLLWSKGISAVTAFEKGWSELANGELVAAAVGASIDVLITQDRRFQESASRTLRKHPNVAIVLLVLPPQVRRQELVAHLEAYWAHAPIVPVHGGLVTWGKVSS